MDGDEGSTNHQRLLKRIDGSDPDPDNRLLPEEVVAALKAFFSTHSEQSVQFDPAFKTLNVFVLSRCGEEHKGETYTLFLEWANEVMMAGAEVAAPLPSPPPAPPPEEAWPQNAREELAALRKAVEDLSEELEKVHLENAELRQQNEQLKEDIAALRTHVQDLEAQAAKPPGANPPSKIEAFMKLLESVREKLVKPERRTQAAGAATGALVGGAIGGGGGAIPGAVIGTLLFDRLAKQVPEISALLSVLFKSIGTLLRKIPGVKEETARQFEESPAVEQTEDDAAPESADDADATQQRARDLLELLRERMVHRKIEAATATAKELQTLCEESHEKSYIHLDLHSTKVKNLTPLANLTALVALFLHGTKVTDLAPLANLTNLEYLGIEGTRVSDLTPLANLTVLHLLDIGSTQVKDVSMLSHIKGLEIIMPDGVRDNRTKRQWRF